MRRIIVLVIFWLFLIIAFIPVSLIGESKTHAPIIVPPDSVKKSEKIVLLENHSSEYIYQNSSLEFLTFSHDVFSDIQGMRPFPWGGEVFEGEISFICGDYDSYDGRKSFIIKGNTSNSHGALAVPDLPLKPKVKPGQLYFLGCWVKYHIESGKGIRLTQQFFLPEDKFYPTYSCFGKWKRGSSKNWVFLGLLVKAPQRACRGDPVIELWGKGEIKIDKIYFGPVEIIDEEGAL